MMIDESNMYKILENFPQQIRDGYKLGEGIDIQDQIDGIAICGMGGSALPDEIMKCYVELDIPIIIVRNYKMPSYITKKTLVVLISYSGNTEETLECYKQASRLGCPMMIIASGGKLEETAKKQGIDFIKIPSGFQPRQAYGYQFFALLRVLENSGYIEPQAKLVENTASLIEDNLEKIKENAKKIVDKLDRKVPIVYSAERNWAIAYKWKINFNENTKIHAFWNVFPELNHNELMGFEHMFADFAVIMIRDDEDHARIKKRMDITKKLIKARDCNVIEVAVTGRHRLTKIFSAIYIGDWVSYFLALHYGTDPIPVRMIEEFKKEMDK